MEMSDDKEIITFEVDGEFKDEIDATAEMRGYDDRSKYLRDIARQDVSTEILEDEIARLEDQIESLEEKKENIEQDIQSKKALLSHKRNQLEEKEQQEQSVEEELEAALNTVAAYLAVDDDEIDVTVAAQSSVETVLKVHEECEDVDDVLGHAEERIEDIDPEDYLPDGMVASTSEQDLADKYNL